MADTWTRVEHDRFEAMKHLRIDGLSFAQMVPKLREMELLACPKCDDENNQRRNSDGDVICVTCTDTIAHQWRRNLAKLSEDIIDILEVKWQWVEVHRRILAKALASNEAPMLRLASEVATKLARAVGFDYEEPPEDPDEEMQNVPRGLVIKRPPPRSDRDRPN